MLSAEARHAGAAVVAFEGGAALAWVPLSPGPLPFRETSRGKGVSDASLLGGFGECGPRGRAGSRDKARRLMLGLLPLVRKTPAGLADRDPVLRRAAGSSLHVGCARLPGWRWIRLRERSATGWSGCGGRRWRLR